MVIKYLSDDGKYYDTKEECIEADKEFFNMVKKVYSDEQVIKFVEYCKKNNIKSISENLFCGFLSSNFTHWYEVDIDAEHVFNKLNSIHRLKYHSPWDAHCCGDYEILDVTENTTKVIEDKRHSQTGLTKSQTLFQNYIK